jgi:hypothetical protein
LAPLVRALSRLLVGGSEALLFGPCHYFVVVDWHVIRIPVPLGLDNPYARNLGREKALSVRC